MKKLLAVVISLSVGFGAFAAADDKGEWHVLFDGTSIEDWKITEENPDSIKLEDGKIVAHGPRAHLFYNGPVNDHDFKNFIVRAEVMTTPGSNSGLYFHCKYQPDDWPDTGYEAQVNNTHGDPKKTGGIYDVINVFEAPAKDDEWFDYEIKVVGKTIEVKIDGKVTAQYDEKDKAKLDKRSKGSDLSSGTFAIQAHDPKSKVYFKNIRVQILPD